MTPSDWEAISALYFKIVALDGPARAKVIAQAQDETPEIMAEVAQMLEEEEGLHPALRTEGPWFGETAEQDRQLIGHQLGHYELIDYLGGGGMGSVFLAKRVDGELERQVALKLIRSTYQKPEALERFRRERQILAGLQHPNIAQLYEGGRSKDGRLYFTMEHVKGQTLVEYCRKKQLTQDQRLDVFAKVGKAIAHAHRQLVLHLDIKPGNILVEDNGLVKVVDFGVSRWVEDSNAASNTRMGIPYTLAFAAPEQITLDNLSTATDIYALGVLLYKLLTDQLPFDRNSLANVHSIEERMALAKKDERVFRFSSAQRLKGDLFLICAKCLQTDPAERYGSVEQLLNDLQAFRQRDPISIRRQQPLYVASKFLQRNRGSLIAAAIVLLTLLGTATYYTLQLRKERNQAQKEAAKSKQLVGLLTDMFKSADPYIAQNDTLPVRYFLDSLSQNLPNRLGNEPELLADMSALLGSVYNALGSYHKADSMAQTAIDLYLQLDNSSGSSLSNAYNTLGKVQFSLGDYEGADSIFQIALQFYQKQEPLPEELGNCYLALGDTRIEMGRFPQADSFFILSYQNYETVHDPPHIGLASALQGRGTAQRKMRNYQESLDFYTRSLEMKRALLKEPNTQIALTLNHLASLYHDQFKFDEGIPYALESYRQRLAIFGPVNVETIASQSNLARLYSGAKRNEEALRIRRELLAPIKQIFGDQLHPYVMAQKQNIATLLGLLERREESADAYLEIIKLISNYKGNYPTLYLPYHGYGLNKYYLGDRRTAETYLRMAVEKIPDSPRVLPGDQVKLHYDLAVCLYENHKLAEARKVMAQAKSLLLDYPDLPPQRIARMEEILSTNIK